VLYFIPPMIAAYGAMQWAIERYVDDWMGGIVLGCVWTDSVQERVPQLQAWPCLVRR
jgi:hypothetical protein